VPVITRTVRELAADQPVERAATLEDVRADVLAPDRLNAMSSAASPRSRSDFDRRRGRRAGLFGERPDAANSASASLSVRSRARFSPVCLPKAC